MFEFSELSKVKLMIYGGAHSGIWGIMALRYLPGLRIIGIEANPNIYCNYYPQLSRVFSSYIHAALSSKSGITTFYIKKNQERDSSNLLKRIDNKVFARYHRDKKKARERWRTDGSLFTDMAGSEAEFIVPTIAVSNLISKSEETLLFLDIEGEDFNILANLETIHFKNICVIYVESLQTNDHSRSSSYEYFMDRFEELGFIYFGNDRRENKEAFNMLFIRKELVKLLDPTKFPEASFKFNMENLMEKSIISRLRVARVPMYTFLSRIISTCGIDVHKIR